MDKAFMKWTASDGLQIGLIILVALLFYAVGAAVLRYLVKHAVERTRQRSWHRKDVEKRQRTLVALFINLWRVLVVAVAAFGVLTVLFGTINLAPLFASAGIIGVAVGFGSQSLVKDFLSGIFIISENQYRVGDIIDIDGNSGTVERIGTRSTVIRDADGNVHYFPNGTIQHVINKTMGYSMARFSIGVHPSTDLDAVIELINETGKKLASEEKWKNKIINPPAFESLAEFTQATVSIVVSGKTQPSDQWSVTAEMRRRLLVTFEKKQIELGTGAAPPAKK
jgi:small conductance mechanosensitive channel